MHLGMEIFRKKMKRKTTRSPVDHSQSCIMIGADKQDSVRGHLGWLVVFDKVWGVTNMP